jgi:hypothetical protein
MGHIYKRGTIYWIKFYRDGRPFYESSGSPKESFARNLLKLREGEVAMQIPTTPKMGKLRFADLAGDVVNDYRVNGKKSIDDVERRFRKHLLPFFGRKLASSISTADVRRFIDQRQDAGASNAEINRELAAFKRAYSLAIKDGRLRTRPYIPFLKENNVRTGFLTRSEMEEVCRLLSPPLPMAKPRIQLSFDPTIKAVCVSGATQDTRSRGARMLRSHDRSNRCGVRN